MTPSELEEYARQQYNAGGDTFFSQAEIFRHIYQAEMELATKSGCIKTVYTASTVAATQEYSRPTNAIVLKRLTYEGTKLAPITLRQGDADTATGAPTSYFEWGSSFYLRPTPDAVGTLKIFTVDKPQTVSVGSVLDVPDRYHYAIADYVGWRIALKDRALALAREYKAAWERAVVDAVVHERKRLRGDEFYGVGDESELSVIGSS
jgi:hypothetical protein